MKDENRIVPVAVESNNNCTGCIYYSMCSVARFMPCLPDDRQDGRNVVFVLEDGE